MYDQSPGVPGPSRRRTNIPSQMEEPARSNRFAGVLGVEASGTSASSESEMLQKLPEFAQVNPWATRFMANPRLVAVRPQGNDGAEDTPPAGHMNGDEHPVSPPAAPVANLNVSTPERSIPDPSPSHLLPSTTNVATTQPPACVTPQGRESSTLSPERAQETSLSTPKDDVLEDVSWVVNNLRFPGFQFNSFFIFTANTQIPYCILDLVFFLESCIF